MCSNSNSVAVELIRVFDAAYRENLSAAGHDRALERATEVVETVYRLVKNVDR